MSLCIIRRATFAVCLLALAGLPQLASADSWLPPETQVHVSNNGEWRLTVEPASIDSTLDYFLEEAEAERAGVLVERPAPLALLERRTGGGFEPVWAVPLVNSVSPVDAYVAPDGSRIVTLDNWHSMGLGENVMVIYDGAGNVLRSMALGEILPEDYVLALPRSVSSLHWRRAAGFAEDSRSFVIDVAVPAEDSPSEKTVALAISMEDGGAMPLSSAEWDLARAAADRRLASMKEAEAEHIAFLMEPLVTPPADSDGWHQYLREAHLRLTPHYLDMPVASATIVDPPDHERHARSVGWLVDAFEDDVDFGGEIALAAPGFPESLIAALEKAADTVPTGALNETIVYISIDAAHRNRAEALVGRMGAQFVWLDPQASIPQRPERVPGSPEEIEARAEMGRRQDVEMREMLEELGD